MISDSEYLQVLQRHLDNVTHERCELAGHCELIGVTVLGVSTDVEAVEGPGHVEKDWELISEISCASGCPTAHDVKAIQQEAIIRSAQELSLGLAIMNVDGLEE
jgi:hypothetical protein